MAAPAYVSEFRELHEKAKAGKLTPAERRIYESERADLTRLMLARQSLLLPTGQNRRREVRVARALPVKIDGPDSSQRSLTVEVSFSGFSALLGTAPGAVGGKVSFGLLLPGSYFMPGEARIMNVDPQAGSFRVGCLILAPTDDDVERLKLVVFDEVLSGFFVPG